MFGFESLKRILTSRRSKLGHGIFESSWETESCGTSSFVTMKNDCLCRAGAIYGHFILLLLWRYEAARDEMSYTVTDGSEAFYLNPCRHLTGRKRNHQNNLQGGPTVRREFKAQDRQTECTYDNRKPAGNNALFRLSLSYGCAERVCVHPSTL